MIKLEHKEVMGWSHAIYGARNPMNSWDRMDSYEDWPEHPGIFKIGPNDHKLLMRLAKAGSDHRKWMRMVTVYVDITAPLYWWKEFDTYKVGTVANSCSTMHKIHAKPFELADFSHDHLLQNGITLLQDVVRSLNTYRDLYLEDKDKVWWQQMIQLLPSSYNQKRTVMLNYEVLRNMYHARKNHKLEEWHEFCDWIEKLPYSEFITEK
jgi:hypothetical protein